CPRATTGHAAAAPPPTRPRNSRRLIRAPMLAGAERHSPGEGYHAPLRLYVSHFTLGKRPRIGPGYATGPRLSGDLRNLDLGGSQLSGALIQSKSAAIRASAACPNLPLPRGARPAQQGW